MAKNKDDNTLIFLLLGAGLLFFLFRKKPQPKKIEQVLKDAFNNLNFEFNKSVILPTSFESLNELASVMNQTTWNLKLSGHTDNKGSESYNLKLSENRAKAVKNYLVAQGVDPSRIESKGFGSTQPIAPNDTEENRAINRRVEFQILK